MSWNDYLVKEIENTCKLLYEMDCNFLASSSNDKAFCLLSTEIDIEFVRPFNSTPKKVTTLAASSVLSSTTGQLMSWHICRKTNNLWLQTCLLTEIIRKSSK